MSATLTIAKERPPIVMFEYLEYGVNKEASEKAGRPIPAVVLFAKIMQHGDKHTVTEKVADEWLAQLKQKSIEGTYNPEWYQRFKLQYDEFLKGNELPRDGTPVKTCPLFNGEQARRLVAVGITTVEDLAAQPDQALGNIGLDGRVLRDSARMYIDQGKGVAGTARRIAELEQDKRRLEETVEAMQKKLDELAPKKK